MTEEKDKRKLHNCGNRKLIPDFEIYREGGYMYVVVGDKEYHIIYCPGCGKPWSRINWEARR